MSSTRDHILEITCALMETQGYHATGLNQILAESGAPKGSLYYHFPDGKEGLTSEAIARVGRQMAHTVRQALLHSVHEEAGEALHAFISTMAGYVEASDFRCGGPLMTVAMETAATSERINQACRAAYQLLQEAFQEKLLSSGFSDVRATQLALFVTSTLEGAIILSRTNHSGEPLRRVADELRTYLHITSRI